MTRTIILKESRKNPQGTLKCIEESLWITKNKSLNGESQFRCFISSIPKEAKKKTIPRAT